MKGLRYKLGRRMDIHNEKFNKELENIKNL